MRKLFALALLWPVVAASAAQPAGEAAEVFEAGVHYEVLPIAVEQKNPGTVEVAEVFSYACVHCFNFDPLIEAWRVVQPNDVEFVRLPAIFSPDWALLAQAFYAAEILGVADKVHEPMFEAIHTHGLDMRQPALMAKLFNESAGVGGEEFSRVYNSFSVRSKVEQAKGKGQAYRITGVPSMVVNGKYRTDGRMAGGNTQMLQVVDYLVELERRPAADEGG